MFITILDEMPCAALELYESFLQINEGIFESNLNQFNDLVKNNKILDMREYINEYRKISTLITHIKDEIFKLNIKDNENSNSIKNDKLPVKISIINGQIKKDLYDIIKRLK